MFIHIIDIVRELDEGERWAISAHDHCGGLPASALGGGTILTKPKVMAVAIYKTYNINMLQD